LTILKLVFIFVSLEGMLVSVSSARVVGPTDSKNDTWVIRSDLGIERVFYVDPAGTGEVICVGTNGDSEIDLPVKVGDQILEILGVLDYVAGVYRLSLLTPQIPIDVSPPEPTESFEPAFTFGIFNLESLLDGVDDPTKDDPVLSPTENHRKLEKLALTIHHELSEPAFLAVQEVENEIVLNHLLARAEADYGVA